MWHTGKAQKHTNTGVCRGWISVHGANSGNGKWKQKKEEVLIAIKIENSRETFSEKRKSFPLLCSPRWTGNKLADLLNRVVFVRRCVSLVFLFYGVSVWMYKCAETDGRRPLIVHNSNIVIYKIWVQVIGLINFMFGIEIVWEFLLYFWYQKLYQTIK